MPPTTRSSAHLKLAAAWDEDSDSSLTDVEDSDEETEQPVQAPPPCAQARPQPQPQQGPSRPIRNIRKATQQATEERKTTISKDEGPLPPYNQSGPTVDQIYGWIEAGLILLEPDYQRDVVWNETKQMNLIDSLYKNYPVPNLVFVREYHDGEYSRVCIDGKQRLTSIKRFMNGEIAYRDPGTKKKLWYKKTAPSQKRILVSEEWKRKFRAKTLTFYDYENINPSQERMIFQRVQLGTVLTPAERLQAANGGCADFLRELRNCVCSTQVFSNFKEWGKSKGKNFLALCQIVFLVETEKLPTALPEPDKLTPWLEGPLINTGKIQKSVLLAFNVFGRLSLHEKYGLWLSTQGVSPVEFVMAIYAIVIFMDDLTDCKLADGIRKMWDADRNPDSTGKGSKITKAGANKSYVQMRNFVEKMAKVRIELEYDPTELVKAADMPVLSEEQIDMLRASEAPSTKAAVKRSRSVVSSTSKPGRDDSVSDDEAPLSRSKKGGKPSASKKSKLNKAAKEAKQVEPEEEDGDVIPTVTKREPVSKGVATRKPSGVQAKGSTAAKPSSAATRVKRPSTSRAPPPPTAPVPSTSSSQLPPLKITVPPLQRPSTLANARVGGKEPGPSKNTPVRSQPNTPLTRTAPLPPDFGNGVPQSSSSVSGTTTTTAAPLVPSATIPASSFPPIIAEPLNTAGTLGVSTSERLKSLKNRRQVHASQRASSTPSQASPTLPAQVPSAQEYPTPPEEGCVVDAQPAIARKPAPAPAAQSSMKNQNAAQAVASRPSATASSAGQQQAKPANRPSNAPQANASPTEPSAPVDVLDALHSKKGSYENIRFSKRVQPPQGSANNSSNTGTQPNPTTSGSEAPFTYDGWIESISAQATRLQQQQTTAFSNSNLAPLARQDAPQAGVPQKRRRSVYDLGEPQGGAKRTNTNASGSGSFGSGQGALGLNTPPPSAGRLPYGSDGFGLGRSGQTQPTVDPRLAKSGPPPR
ncbi:hypothetical protein EST38_g9640 [Candolleomyces aberdarensis]|uniref:GmrSD restriction endonucleases N-terminal domain-containing protein n=1 Tax=Candolleomyces aberdarensis TaxID=2316362 RepID=A0A4Q2DBL2_9AGAR|nr:hypothetical protein EST38_g9640 [Candolleomyces aberdarensis]